MTNVVIKERCEDYDLSWIRLALDDSELEMVPHFLAGSNYSVSQVDGLERYEWDHRNQMTVCWSTDLLQRIPVNGWPYNRARIEVASSADSHSTSLRINRKSRNRALRADVERHRAKKRFR